MSLHLGIKNILTFNASELKPFLVINMTGSYNHYCLFTSFNMVHLIITASCFFQYSDDFAFFAMTSLMFLVYVPILCGTNLWHYRMLSIQKINTLKFPWKVIHAHKIHYQASSGYANSCMPCMIKFSSPLSEKQLERRKNCSSLWFN